MCTLAGTTRRSSSALGYWSRSLSSAERNYSTPERESLAIAWAVLLLRPYLEGVRYILRTDHAPLK